MRLRNGVFWLLMAGQDHFVRGHHRTCLKATVAASRVHR